MPVILYVLQVLHQGIYLVESNIYGIYLCNQYYDHCLPSVKTEISWLAYFGTCIRRQFLTMIRDRFLHQV